MECLASLLPESYYNLPSFKSKMNKLDLISLSSYFTSFFSFFHCWALYRLPWPFLNIIYYYRDREWILECHPRVLPKQGSNPTVKRSFSTLWLLLSDRWLFLTHNKEKEGKVMVFNENNIIPRCNLQLNDEVVDQVNFF